MDEQEAVQFSSDVELHLPRVGENTGNFAIRLEHFRKALHSALEAEVGYSDEMLADSVEHERKLLQYRRDKGVGDDVALSLPAMACGPTGISTYPRFFGKTKNNLPSFVVSNF